MGPRLLFRGNEICWCRSVEGSMSIWNGCAFQEWHLGLLDLPTGWQAVKSKWVFKLKVNGVTTSHTSPSSPSSPNTLSTRNIDPEPNTQLIHDTHHHIYRAMWDDKDSPISLSFPLLITLIALFRWHSPSTIDKLVLGSDLYFVGSSKANHALPSTWSNQVMGPAIAV